MSEVPQGFDLVVGADGLNSVVRSSLAFQPRIEMLTNKFVWYGTTKRFETLSQTFVETKLGAFNAPAPRELLELASYKL